MAWEDVPDKLIAYDAKTYADNTNGTTASMKLLLSFGATTAAGVPVELREEFEEQLDYRSGACGNLAASKALPFKVLKDLT